ncbi:MAG: DUF6050 family protein [Eubacteriales bacterium]|nr:DUF6050 family protein [Eubacteriales bacterium]
MMTIVDVFKKSIVPLGFMAFWLWIVKLIMEVSGSRELLMFLFLAGLPFGIHKMFVILIPKDMDIGGTVGMAALSVIIGGMMGCFMIPVYVVKALYVLIQYIFRR